MTHAEVDVDCIIFTLRVTNQDQLIVMLLNQYYQEHDFLIIHNKIIQSSYLVQIS